MIQEIDLTTSSSTSRVAVVTGAARGIGLATAQWFLRNGYQVALIDNDAATLAQTDKQFNNPHNVLAVNCDVSKPEQVAQAVQTIVGHFGRVDALVNNAGVAVFKPIGETTFEDWRFVMATNLDGAYLCTQAFVPAMLQNGGGSVVNIASISGLRASTLRVAYGTSKAAVIGLTKSVAADYVKQGIRCNCICPGTVDTPSLQDRINSYADPVQARKDFINRQPMGRLAQAHEIAPIVVYLASDESSFTTGTAQVIDGGWSN